MSTRIKVIEDILEVNKHKAASNRDIFDQSGVFTINLMASPGAGKTSLIELTIKQLSHRISIAVIDGDIATSLDADRAAAAGAKAVQINTGGGCHLDAVMIEHALKELPLNKVDLLLIENVGNLICPAGFPLGTHQNILIASTPEGDDKPYKYPTMYNGVDALIINKIDLLPYVSFNMDYFCQGVEILNPGLVTFPMSCQTQEGLELWLQWIIAQVENNQKRLLIDNN